MRCATTRLLAAAGSAGLIALALTAAAPSGTTKNTATARALAVRIVVPDATGAGTEEVVAPLGASAATPRGAFSYPDDGSIVAAGSTTATAATAKGKTMRAQASAEVASLSVFGGEVTVERVTAHARSAAGAKSASGLTDGTAVTGLVVLGQPAGTGRVPLGDWGYADLSAGSARRLAARGANAYRASAVALSIRLIAAHGALPAGTQILVGSVDATARAAKASASVAPRPRPKPRPAKPKPKPKSASAGPRRAVVPTRPPEPKPSPFGVPRIRKVPRNVTVPLTPRGYVFPVFGPSSWSDTFGAPRADTGWHHGEDIFAPLGAPVLAVNDGWVFSVGRIPIGGNRLWLRDDQGNQFYYAHLSAYSPLAVNGRRVRAGDVLGFVGNTGDARGTPFHLHFEIHPVRLLRLGYDGAVNPSRFLSAWQHLQDLPFPVRRPAGRVRVASEVGAWAGSGVTSGGTAPVPGAILLQASDISQASGLDLRSVERALVDPARGEGDGALLRG